MIDGRNIEREPDASDEDESEGIDSERIREILGFILRAARRRRKFAWLTFVTIAGLGLAFASVLPRVYSAQVKFLADRSSRIRILSSLSPGIDDVDNPTMNVATMIGRRDNVVALVREANLVKRFRETRPPLFKIKDRVVAKLFGAPTDEDMERSMVGTLETKLEVTTEEQSTVTIKVDWSNAQLAYDLVTLVQKNFLEARYDSDVTMITDSIAVLDDHAKSELAQFDSELDVYNKVVADKSAKLGLRTTVPASHRALMVLGRRESGLAAVTPADPEIAKAIDEKKLQIQALEGAQQHTLDALRQQLMQAQTTLTPMHPTVIALQEQIDALNRPSPELLQLKDDVRSLTNQSNVSRAAAELVASVPSTGVVDRTGAASDESAAVTTPLPMLASPELDRDGEVQLEESKLAMAMHGYRDALARIDVAKTELDVTRALYKHRYTVVTPAELPRSPTKSTATVVRVAAVLGGALLAFLLSAAADMATGSILESWQIRRRLKLEVLGEFESPS